MSAVRPWDIFCRVIDNYGDIGVCWRLCVNLSLRGHLVRLWVDDASALQWMAPEGFDGVQVLPWNDGVADAFAAMPRAAVVVEAFGCDLPQGVVRHMAAQPPVWINLEYLSAEPFVQRCHGLPSPVTHGAGVGLTKWFFYPGFTVGTGGLLREPDLLARQQAFDRTAWLAGLGLADTGQRLVSLFCYEPPVLADWLQQLLAANAPPSLLLVTSGRSEQAVRAALQQLPTQAVQATGQGPARCLGDRIAVVPALSQVDFDHLLWACDLNLVRGEDSLVRALWAGKPLIWQIYPQDDAAHHAKLNAFLDLMNAPDSLRQAHRAWNGIGHTALPVPDLCAWRESVQATRERLLHLPDLTTQLLGFVEKNR